MDKAIEELTNYTLNKGDKEFIHQHVVDAYTAQFADDSTKPITLFFALAGLYLFLEKNFSGKEVQNAHIRMAHKTKEYPKIKLQPLTAEFKITEVFKSNDLIETDKNIYKWCVSVWQSYSDVHEMVKVKTDELLAKKV